MENLCNVCQKIVEEYKKYKYIYSETEKETFIALSKFQKALDKLGEKDDIFVESAKKFWEKYKEDFSMKKWEEDVVKLPLYNGEELIKGPLLHLSDISYLAKEVDEHRPKGSKLETMKSRLDKALFKVISSVDGEFGKKEIRQGGNALPFDFSKLGDIVGNIVESGIISNSTDNVDKEEIVQTVNSFIANPKLNEFLSSFVQSLGGKETTINTDSLKEVLSKANNEKE